jgi:hypothetical protein
MMIWAGIFGLVVVASVAGLLFSARLVSRRPDLARVGIEGGYLVVRLPWMATLVAFRRKLRFEQAAIKRVTAADRSDLPQLGLRLGGTGTPNLQAGRFATTNQTGLIFCLIGRAQRFLQIDFDRGDIRYLVVQVSDPDSLATELLRASRG